MFICVSFDVFADFLAAPDCFFEKITYIVLLSGIFCSGFTFPLLNEDWVDSDKNCFDLFNDTETDEEDSQPDDNED